VLHRQRRLRLLVLVGAFLTMLILALGFWLGQRVAHSSMGIDPESYRQLQEQLPEVRAESLALTQELEVQRTRNEVDRRALELVRGDIAEQKEQISSLEEGLRFYRSLMAPGEIANGLSLREIELVSRSEAGRYAFRIVAQQEARKHDTLRGELYAEVYGKQDGEHVKYPLAALSGDLEGDAVPLRFRYFQAIEGELVLPEGFTPEGVNVVASANSPRKVEVREQYSWQIQERFTHAGR
jgi:Arc/MetJ-type ribon-helix-helix transcriptional regulator